MDGAAAQERDQRRRLGVRPTLAPCAVEGYGRDRPSVTKAVSLYNQETATLALNDLFSYIRHRLQNQFLEQWLRQAKQTLLGQLPPGSDATGSSDNHGPGPRQDEAGVD